MLPLAGGRSSAQPNLEVGGFQKSSLIDYPGKISAIIFTQGCNFRCPYCHNPELIKKDENITVPDPLEILDFLTTRVGKLDGVVITGGEPCLHQGLSDFIREVKSLGFLVKLDTNGSHSRVLKYLLEQKLVDYVAMDIKAPLEKYSKVACREVDTSSIIKSIQLLKDSAIGFEFRTTVVKSQLDFEDFEEIGKMIGGQNSTPVKYYLQKFVPTKTLNKTFISAETYTDEEFEQLALNLKKYVNEVFLR